MPLKLRMEEPARIERHRHHINHIQRFNHIRHNLHRFFLKITKHVNIRTNHHQRNILGAANNGMRSAIIMRIDDLEIYSRLDTHRHIAIIAHTILSISILVDVDK